MLNKSDKKKSIDELEFAIKKYDSNVIIVQEKSLELFNIRQKSGENVIKPVEDYINQLANSPKEFDKSFTEYKAEFKIFNDLIENFKVEALNTDFKAGGAAAGGVAIGAGTAALLPTAAMAFATTFGTASTGTAIASLSGAAATNAALAWLGGGALVAGGGGMASGSALLAFAGPIGIGIGAIGIIGGSLYASSKNKEIIQEANSKRKEIETANVILNTSKIEITELLILTNKHQFGVLKQLNELKKVAPENYMAFTNDQKLKLGSLVNHINSLTALINKKVE